MKGIYLVAILYAATLGVVGFNESPVAVTPTKCPEVNPRNETVFIPHETDCTKFYSCHMGIKGKPLDCPFMDKNGNRLHFNPRLQVCDWPWSAGCQISSTSSSSSPTSTTPSSTTQTTPSPSTPTPTTSSPSSSTSTTPSPSPSTSTTPSPSPSTTTTPSPSPSTTSTPSPSPSTSTTPLPTTTTTPSPSTSTTPSPSPSTPTTSSTSSPTPTTPSNSCKSDNRIHMLPHKTMCDHYYSCFNDIVNPIPKKCNRNLLFNPVLRVCDYPENVNCTNIPPTTGIVPSTIRSLTTSVPSTPPLFSPMPTKSVDPAAWVCVPNGKKHYKVPHETMCNYYYWCVNGIKGTEPVKCVSYLLFNPVIGECDYPENVDCNGRNTPPQDTTTTTTTTTTTPIVTETIPTITKTTTTTTTTETPTTTTTTKTPTTTTTTETPTTPRDITKPRKNCPPRGSPEKARIAHPCLCNLYYECVHGEKILERCPIGKHFDYVREVCDWAGIVKCTRPIPTFDTLTFDVLIHDYNITCAPEGRALQHETDCTAYYLCSNGEKVLKHCVEGLHFNVSIQNCDYPQKICDLNGTVPIISLDFCPPPDSIQKVFLPHECECTQYYECIGGKRVLRSCPKGLYFDRVGQICNDRFDVTCESDTISATPRTVSTTTSMTKITDKPRITCPPKGSTKNLRFSHPCLCNQYYECVEGDRILRTCPDGMYFDDAKEVCDWDAEVKCIRPLPSRDIQIGDDIKCSPDGRAFRHEVNCTNYYLCSKGEKVLKHCVEGLHFNVSLQMCDYPRKKCDLTSPLPTVALDVCPPVGSAEKVLLPHECECTQYYECIDGKKVLQDCSNGLHYDHVRQICNEPIEAKCVSIAATVSIKGSFSISDLGRCYDENNEMPHEYDCRSYYKCINGEKILKTCPRNLYFNAKLRLCDFPENVACGTRSASVPSIPTLTKCSMITGTDKIPHETDCNLYYACENGVNTLKKCNSPELVFNPILKVCDFKENYICNLTRAKNDIEETDKMTIQNLNPSTCIGTCPDEDPEYAVLLPNDDCKKFCMCSGGVAWVQSCPDPLYFDSVQKICKRKKDAVCAKRLFSQNDAFTIDETVDNDNSVNTLTNEKSYNEYGIYDNLDPSTCIGTCPEEDPEYAVLLPNDDCKKFCMCSGGVAWVQSCPEPLYFDSVQNVCKRKKDAVCAVRSLERSLTDRMFDDPAVSLSEENYNERGIYDNPWYKRRFYNVDPSKCIGICPEEESAVAELLPHEECRKFCICSNGLVYVQLCPESLYFHSVDKVCRQRTHAVCAVDSFKRNHAITIITKDDEDDSMEYLSDENNNKRHNYIWPKPYFHNFNPSSCLGMCSEDDSKYAIIHPNKDCTKFCLCSNGMTWIQSCPESLYFDSIHKRCKRKKDAVCAVHTSNRNHAVVINKENDRIEFLSEEKSDERELYDSWSKHHSYNLDTSTCIGTCSNEDDYIVLLPNVDCRKFCICSSGLVRVQQCPASFYFDSVDKICKLNRNAICAIDAFSKSQLFNEAINENNLSSNEEKNDNRKKRDNSLSKLYFSIHQTITNDPSTCIGTCPEEDPEYAVLLPNEDCKKFCMCSGGVAWIQSCAEPLYFDSVHKVCKRKKDAVCAKRSFSQDDASSIDKTIDNENSIKTLTNRNIKYETYDNLDPSTCIGTCPEEDPEYAVLLPNEDCKKFCMCSGGVAWVQSCAEPLYFDSVHKVCKRKKDAVCAKRSFSQDDASSIDKTVDNDNSLNTLTNENNNEYGIYDNLDPSTCIGTCPEEDPEYAVLLPNEDCKKFCMCSGGVAWVQSCPEPLYFDSLQKICKRKKDAVCGVRPFNEDHVLMFDKK